MAVATARPVAQQPARVGFRRRGVAKEWASILWAIIAWAVGLLAFFPVLYMFLTAFKTETAAVSLPPRLIFQPTLEQFRTVLGGDFLPFFRNSAIASLVSTALVMILAVPAAYALALRPPKKWKDILFFFISTRFMPAAGVIVPLYIIFREAGLLGTMRGLIILYTAMNLPIAVWMLRSFFEEVPKDVLDAAEVDGAGVMRLMSQILLPMIAPGIAATIFISIIFAWNEFFFAVSLAAAGTATVPIFMVKFVTSEGLFWAKLAASSTMAVLPIVLLGWVAQRQLVRGLSMGAVK
ncbi:MAG: carbohydrate ABC transporter permease [Chloroflexota bacterium]|nr:carbohydrate ABC transporter permease [Chloroflexota bacterium]